MIYIFIFVSIQDSQIYRDSDQNGGCYVLWERGGWRVVKGIKFQFYKMKKF